MMRKWLGWGVPFAVTVMGLLLLTVISVAPTTKKSISVGLLVAFGQSIISTGALVWASQKKYFYWVWGGGMLFRLIVFAVLALLLLHSVSFSMVATLLALVGATTFFLVFESFLVIGK